jgi:hypothetical protein
MMPNQFPPGWDEQRVKKLLDHYESQAEDEAMVEDEAAYEDPTHARISIPIDLVPQVQALIASHSQP